MKIRHKTIVCVILFAIIRCVPAATSEWPLKDDFESDSIAPFWLPHDYGSGLYVPGAVKISTNFARSGRHSLEMTVHENDIAQDGGDGHMTERADMDSGHFALLDKEAWYAFSVLFPTHFPIVNNRLVFGSCKQGDVPRPILAQRFRNGRHTFTIESQGKRKEYKLPKLKLGEWCDMIYHVRYATNQSGLVEIWMNGKQVVSYRGPTAEAAYKKTFYHKIGLYRDRIPQPMTAYFDNYEVSAKPIKPK
jgi:hypothetical protein